MSYRIQTWCEREAARRCVKLYHSGVSVRATIYIRCIQLMSVVHPAPHHQLYDHHQAAAAAAAGETVRSSNWLADG